MAASPSCDIIFFQYWLSFPKEKSVNYLRQKLQLVLWDWRKSPTKSSENMVPWTRMFLILEWMRSLFNIDCTTKRPRHQWPYVGQVGQMWYIPNWFPYLSEPEQPYTSRENVAGCEDLICEYSHSPLSTQACVRWGEVSSPSLVRLGCLCFPRRGSCFPRGKKFGSRQRVWGRVNPILETVQSHRAPATFLLWLWWDSLVNFDTTGFARWWRTW